MSGQRIEAELRQAPAQIQFQSVPTSGTGRGARLGKPYETRNGLPETVHYVYRGTGEDTNCETSNPGWVPYRCGECRAKARVCTHEKVSDWSLACMRMSHA